MADITRKTFAENVNHVAELDNSLGYELVLRRSNIVLNDNVAYSAVTEIRLFNRATNMTETISVPSASLTAAGLNAYLGTVKAALELAYPSCVMTHSVTHGTFINTQLTVVLSGNDYYLRSINIKISEADGIQYDIDGQLTSPLEITPSFISLNAGTLADINSVAANATNINAVAANEANIDIVSADKANIDAVAANKANIDAVAANESNINAVIGSAAATAADVLLTHADVLLTHADVVLTNADVVSADASADIATAQAAMATTKAGESLASANASEASRIAAAGILDSFDDRYLGAKSSEPLLDNDGNALLDGALYFDSTTKKMRVWDSISWGDALTLTATSISILTNKTIDDISNKVGANHIYYPVRNVSGSTIAAGTVVTAQGTQNGTDYVQVVPVTNPQTQIALGIMHTTVANNGTGLCMNTGVSADQVDTSGWAVGTILYPNNTGGLTSTKPTSGHYQACAVVLRSHANQGTLLVEFTEPKYIASTTQAGYVQLNDTLTSTSTVQALTAAQGKVLNDRLVTVENGTVQEGDSVTLTGDVTGTALFDANGNISITTTVVDDSHNHVISNVDGLQTALDGKQPIDATLTALAGVTTSADKYIYATAADTFTTGTITSFGRSLVDDVDAATARGTLGISATNTPSTAVGGISATNVQAALQELDSEKANSVDMIGAIGNINSPLLDMPLKNSLAMKAGVGSATFTRATTATYIDRYGVLKTAAIDEPRFEKEGYLNEGASTNLWLYSNSFIDRYGSGGSLDLINCSATDNAVVGIDDATSAASIYSTSLDGRFTNFYTTSAKNTVITASIYLKKNTSSTIRIDLVCQTNSNVFTYRAYSSFNFDTGTFGAVTNTGIDGSTPSGSFKSTAMKDGWFRLEATFTTYNGANALNAVLVEYRPNYGSTSGDVYATCAQLEALPFATSYIPTVASTVTRSMDVLSVSYSGNIPNMADNYTIAVDSSTLGFSSTTYQTFIRANDDGRMIRANSAEVDFRGSGVNRTTTPMVKNTMYRLAYSVGTSLNAYVNGTLVGSVIKSVGSGALTVINIGHYSNTSNVFGHITNVRIYDKALTSQEVALA